MIDSALNNALANSQCGPLAKKRFLTQLSQWKNNTHPHISPNEISPLNDNDVIDQTHLQTADPAQRQALLTKLAVIKLNGGLGTSMGCNESKSSLKIKENTCFLDSIAQHICHIQDPEAPIPFFTLDAYIPDTKTAQILRQYPELNWQSIRQNRCPRIQVDTAEPFTHPELAYYPPGHGDIYAVLSEQNHLNSLLKQGVEYLFISNADNIGASIDTAILGYMEANNIDFLMECSTKTKNDQKGGFLARHQDKITLIEFSQITAEHNDRIINNKT